MPSYTRTRNGKTWSVRWSDIDQDGNRIQPYKSGFRSEEEAKRWFENREMLSFMDESVRNTVSNVVRENIEVTLQEIIAERFSDHITEAVKDQMKAWRDEPYTDAVNSETVVQTLELWRSDVDVYNSAVESGSVYFLQGISTGLIKIGTSQYGRISTRISSIKTDSPDPLRLIRLLPGGHRFETALHYYFDECHSHGEWYFPSPGLFAFIDSTLDLDSRLPTIARSTEGRIGESI